ncbi:DinB family protein [uncultured Croceitalea sp.]|uniref:DinB family protein n=1 Tax=uncultured Croceitalea sp. TaxID=1798908 RepID=UPI003305F10D
MKFELNQSIAILERTPAVLKAYLSGLSEDWLKNNEGDGTWSPYDIVGHLIFGEKTDWMVRVKTILGASEDKKFKPFDRFGQFREDQHVPILKILEEFEALRSANITELKSFTITADTLRLEGIHPEFGRVTLAQLIATWAVHDLGHIAQISRVMAKQYQHEVGPWVAYLGILKQ